MGSVPVSDKTFQEVVPTATIRKLVYPEGSRLRVDFQAIIMEKALAIAKQIAEALSHLARLYPRTIRATIPHIFCF